jgi:RNA polymerase sigma-70 factor (ECF subfamily)
VQVAPEARPVQASSAACGGLKAGAQARVPSGAVAQIPPFVSPRGDVSVQVAPAARPLQALIAAAGGAGSVGAQATPDPSSVSRQVPATLFPAGSVSVQAAPAASPVQAAVCAAVGAQASVPLAMVESATAVASSVAVVLLVVLLVRFAPHASTAPSATTSPAREIFAAEFLFDRSLRFMVSPLGRIIGRLAPAQSPAAADVTRNAARLFLHPAKSGTRRRVPHSEALDNLIRRAQDGDVRAFEELLESHVPQVRRFARAFVSSSADADDLAQESLLKVYKSIRLFNYQSAFSSWLYAVVRNVFLDALKSRRGREREKEQALAPEVIASLAAEGAPDEELRRAQEKELLWRALRQVPLEFRSALVLFDLEGHSYDEVAAIEGVPVGTVKSRLSRGRSHLKRVLDEAGVRADDETSSVGDAGTSPIPSPSNDGRR